MLVAVALIIFFTTYAATVAKSIEIEDANVSAPAAVIPDLLASRGKAVQFTAGDAASGGGTGTTDGETTTGGGSPPPVAGGGGSSGGGTSTGTDLPTFFGSKFDSGKAGCTFSHPNDSVANGVLTVNYPSGSAAQSSGAPYGGAQVCEPFTAGPARTATLSYEVRFPVGFDFVKGGKLPGLYGGVEPFSGGNHNSNGWSMRLMWRTGGAAEVYSYISSTTGFGDEYGKGNFTWLADGQWHTVAETITLNSAGASDGSVSLAYDGKTYITQGNLPITTADVPIGGVFFSTFYGGSDKSWAPSADMHIDFRNFSAN